MPVAIANTTRAGTPTAMIQTVLRTAVQNSGSLVAMKR
jgi:hypothetical protein